MPCVSPVGSRLAAAAPPPSIDSCHNRRRDRLWGWYIMRTMPHLSYNSYFTPCRDRYSSQHGPFEAACPRGHAVHIATHPVRSPGQTLLPCRHIPCAIWHVQRSLKPLILKLAAKESTCCKIHLKRLGREILLGVVALQRTSPPF